MLADEKFAVRVTKRLSVLWSVGKSNDCVQLKLLSKEFKDNRNFLVTLTRHEALQLSKHLLEVLLAMTPRE